MVSPVSSSTATTTDTSQSMKQLSGNFSTFLTLLTTQLKNQDPTSPMDSNAFTQQLVMYSQVEQQIDTNTNLKGLISQGVDISKLFFSRIQSGVLQHIFHNGIGPLSVVYYFLQVLCNLVCNAYDFLFLSLCCSFFQIINQFHVYFREVVDEVEWVLYFVGNARSQLTKRGHFLRLNELGLR